MKLLVLLLFLLTPQLQPVPYQASSSLDYCICVHPDPIEIATVHVPDDGVGWVDHAYSIGTYEVTNREYVAFLNSVHVDSDDPNKQLYHENMFLEVDGGIQETECSSHERRVYFVKRYFARKPVNYVSFYSAAKFVNWMHNGQPRGTIGPITDEGVYDLTGPDSYLTAGRAEDATYALCSGVEWYKAALWDPDGTKSGFAVQTDDDPNFSAATPRGHISDPGPTVVNYNSAANWNESVDGNVTTVGSCEAPSGYGTYDQAGNVAEWSEQLQCLGGLCGRDIYGGGYRAVYPPHENFINGLNLTIAPIWLGEERRPGGEFIGGSVGFRVIRLD